eukprot:1756558-Prymnesium_polylepis.1
MQTARRSGEAACKRRDAARCIAADAPRPPQRRAAHQSDMHSHAGSPARKKHACARAQRYLFFGGESQQLATAMGNFFHIAKVGAFFGRTIVLPFVDNHSHFVIAPE